MSPPIARAGTRWATSKPSFRIHVRPRLRLVTSRHTALWAHNIAPEAGGENSRSISLEVQVFARREKPAAPQVPAFVSHFQSYGFMPTTVTVGSDFLLVLPLVYPPGVTPRFPFFTLTCTPVLAAIPRLVPPVPFPGGFGGTLRARRAGTCVSTVYGTDANGPFTETSTVTIQ